MTNRLFIHGRDLLLALDAAIYADTLEPVSSRPDTSQIIVIDWERVQETDKTLIMAKSTVATDDPVFHGCYLLMR